MNRLKMHILASMLIATFISLLAAGVASAARYTSMKSSEPSDVTNRVMSATTAISASDIWAVGYSFTSSSIPQTLTEHWNGSHWSIISSPNIGTGDNYLTGVAAVSTSDVWAVGHYFNDGFFHTLIEHWNGSSWSVVTSPTIGSGQHLQSVTALSKNNVWAVGYYYNGSFQQTLILHWNGAQWSIVSSPNVGAGDSYLSGVTALSASNIWAVGYDDSGLGMPGSTLTEHWNGAQWSVVASPNVGTSSIISGVTAISGNNVWAVGFYDNSSGYSQTLTLHWNGTQWSIVTSPNVGTGYNFLNGVAAVSASNVWAVGSNSNSQTLILRWNGVKWKVVSSPNVGTGSNILNGVTAVAANNVWTVGYYLNATPNYVTLFEHWNGTKWSIAPAP